MISKSPGAPSARVTCPVINGAASARLRPRESRASTAANATCSRWASTPARSLGPSGQLSTLQMSLENELRGGAVELADWVADQLEAPKAQRLVPQEVAASVRLSAAQDSHRTVTRSVTKTSRDRDAQVRRM